MALVGAIVEVMRSTGMSEGTGVMAHAVVAAILFGLVIARWVGLWVPPVPFT